MTSMHTKHDKEHVRWYREPFVWLLITFPLTAVVAGFITLGLAISSDDGVVEDDYYLRGKEINRVLARDQAAATRGLQGRVELDDASQQLLIHLTARAQAAIADNVEIKFLHATRSGIDRILILARQPDGSYRAPLPALAQGHWNVQLAAQDWRLVGSLRIPNEHGLDLRPSLP
ncbi:FixH family protein [Sulfuricaulis limicola]|uniref:FixH family protein n=1 Tax=Sulfuricaulis limicola TaxID=1620215 RepID=A0A1B4XJ09_9GAMM|nr:FixH family protein [Sulfuricaulis limicola]BAV34782.1 FixH family protein [Sulfuricaulis limicola]